MMKSTRFMQPFCTLISDGNTLIKSLINDTIFDEPEIVLSSQRRLVDGGNLFLELSCSQS